MITLTVNGQYQPLIQATLRLDALGTTLEAQIVGRIEPAIGDACVLHAAGYDPIVAEVTVCTPGSRSSTLTAVAVALVGNGAFAPERILYRSERGIRTPPDFSVAPGDTWQGIPITGVTTTVGTRSQSFTEVHF